MVIKKLLKLLIALGLVDIIVGLYFFVALILPAPLMNKNNQITIYSRDEHQILNLHHSIENEYTSLDKMSVYLPICFIVSEDNSFYEHYGYDLKGIFRAMFNNVFKSTKQGGSTITQQLARSLFLNNEKSLLRKIKEAFITARIEMNYSKEEILEQYLNCIYLGHNLYGVENAARYYFNKSSSDLLLNEAALLAGIASSPATLAPDVNLNAAVNKKNQILYKMKNQKIINEMVYNSYKDSEITIYGKHQEKKSVYNYYILEIKKELANLGLDSKKYLARGLNIYTNIDTYVNDIVYKAINRNHLYEEHQVAVLIFKPYSNEILSVFGGFELDDEYNRATMSLRQSGSAIKPLIYYLGLNYGMSPISKLTSEETTFHIKDFGEYSPKNSTGTYANHKITMIEALAVSDNIYATKTLLFLGSEKLVELLEMFGIKNAQAVPSAGLGVNQMSLLQLGSVYNTFASEGMYYTPQFITKVTDKFGNVLYKADEKGKKYLDKTTCLLLSQLLTAPFDSKAKGYATPTLLNYKPKTTYAAKTGTTNQDSYVFAYNPHYTICVWIGTDNNESLTNSHIAKSIFIDIADSLVNNENKNTWYYKPSYISAKKVDPLTGNNDEKGSVYWFI